MSVKKVIDTEFLPGDLVHLVYPTLNNKTLVVCMEYGSRRILKVYSVLLSGTHDQDHAIELAKIEMGQYFEGMGM